MLNKLFIFSLLILLVGCGSQSPTVFIPVKCEPVIIPSLKSMVKNPKDDVEIALRILQQSEMKTNGLHKCQK